MNKMEKVIFTVICSGLLMSLQASELLAKYAFAGWKVNSPWKLNADNRAIINYDRKHEYRKLSKNVALESKICYKLIVEYRFNDSAADTDLFGRFADITFKLPTINDWGKAVVYYRPKETKEYNIYLTARGKTSFNAEIRSVTIEEISEELKKVVYCFDNEPGPCPIQLTKGQRWIKGGDNKAGSLELVAAADHALGGKAIKITKKGKLKGYDRMRVQSLEMPFVAGKKYQVSGWFKADSTGLAQIQLTSPWRTGKKQWYDKKNFRVNQEWEKKTIVFDVPEAGENSTFQLSRIYMSVGLFVNSLNELYIKDITWEML